MNILHALSDRMRSENKKSGLFLFFSLSAALLCAAFCVACLVGSTDTGFFEGVDALLRGDHGSAAYRIIFHIRLPRALGAVLAGSALAVSGVLIQAVLGNPMAAPNLIGVNSGAGLGAAVVIAVFPGAVAALPMAAFLGAMGACMTIYLFSLRSGAGRLTVTLVGIAVGSVLNAGISTVKVLFPDSVYDADIFMIGGLSGVTLRRLFPAWVIIVVCLILAFFLSDEADVLTLGGDSARTLGVNVGLMRFVLLTIACALAGAAVSFAGLLGFVGLLTPHIMRRFVGTRHRLLIPACAMGGATLVLLCDTLSKTLFAPFELPVGISLSLVGGVFFICLVILSGKRGAER